MKYKIFGNNIGKMIGLLQLEVKIYRFFSKAVSKVLLIYLHHSDLKGNSKAMMYCV
jgi:hypothetical protein